MHWADNFSVDWGDPQRASYYGVSGIPISIFDGTLRRSGTRNGSSEETFEWFEEALLERLNTPTDVSLAIEATQRTDDSFSVTTSATLDGDGVAKGVDLYVVEALDHWPTTDDFWRNTLRQPVNSAVPRSLMPGETVDVTGSVTLDATSLSRFDDVKLIAWAQSSETGEVLNATELYLSQLQSSDIGDFNSDGIYDGTDTNMLVAAIIDAGAGNAPDSMFDMNQDGQFDTGDLGEWLDKAATANGFAEPYRFGDANLDGTIDAQDLNAVGRNWQAQTDAWEEGDFNADGVVNASDLNRVGQDWLVTIPRSNAAAASGDTNAVPEPGSGILFLAILPWLYRFRRRSSIPPRAICRQP